MVRVNIKRLLKKENNIFPLIYYMSLRKTRQTRKSKNTKVRNTKKRSQTPSPNVNFWERLYDAIINMDSNMVKHLVKYNKEVLRYNINNTDKYMKKAIENLKFSTHNGDRRWKIIKILSDIGMDINVLTDNGTTILMDIVAEAVYSYDVDDDWDPNTYYPEAVSKLFEFGADINIQTSDGIDAFMIAAGHSGCYDIFYDNNNYNFFSRAKCSHGANDEMLNVLLDNIIKHGIKYNYRNEGKTPNGYKTMLETIDEMPDYHKSPDIYDFLDRFKRSQLMKPTKRVKNK